MMAFMSRLLVPLVLLCPGTCQPNILLFFPDELRYDWLSSDVYYTNHDLPLAVPNLQALLRQGVSFSRAFVPSPVCAPSRACLAAGREYDWAGQGENAASSEFDGDFDLRQPTYMQQLQRLGYWTMVTGRDDLTKRTGPGLDGGYHTSELGFNASFRCAGSVDVTGGECGGFDHGAAPCRGNWSKESQRFHLVHDPYGAYLASQPVSNVSVRERYNASNYFELAVARYDELYSRGEYDSAAWYAIPDTLPFEQDHYQDDWIGRQAVRLLEEAPSRRPWFLEVSHQAPHPPMDITPAMEAGMAGRATGWPAAYDCVDGPLCSDSAVQRMRRNYASKIERLDALLGNYLDVIAARGELNTTVICVASDHGDMLADRNGTAKSKPWNSAAMVPFSCSGPGIARGEVVHSPVATLDLAATLVELAGGTPVAGMNSSSLLKTLHDPTVVPTRRAVFSGLGDFRSVVLNVNASVAFRLVCCNGACPGGSSEDRREMVRRGSGIEVHLFNIMGREYERGSVGRVAGRFEPPWADFAVGHTYDTVLRELAALLPGARQDPNAGFSWRGCNISDWVDRE